MPVDLAPWPPTLTGPRRCGPRRQSYRRRGPQSQQASTAVAPRASTGARRRGPHASPPRQQTLPGLTPLRQCAPTAGPHHWIGRAWLLRSKCQEGPTRARCAKVRRLGDSRASPRRLCRAAATPAG